MATISVGFRPELGPSGGLALGAAILDRRCLTRTNWMCALIGFRGVHLFPPGFGSRADDLGLQVSRP
jgi:hypothetical protein